MARHYRVMNTSGRPLSFPVHDQLTPRTMRLEAGAYVDLVHVEVLSSVALEMSRRGLITVRAPGEGSRVREWTPQMWADLPPEPPPPPVHIILAASPAVLSGVGTVVTPVVDPGFRDYAVRTFGTHEDTTVSPYSISSPSAATHSPWTTEDITP